MGNLILILFEQERDREEKSTWTEGEQKFC